MTATTATPTSRLGAALWHIQAWPYKVIMGLVNPRLYSNPAFQLEVLAVVANPSISIEELAAIGERPAPLATAASRERQAEAWKQELQTYVPVALAQLARDGGPVIDWQPRR